MELAYYLGKSQIQLMYNPPEALADDMQTQTEKRYFVTHHPKLPRPG